MKFLINPTQESLSRARAPIQAFLAFVGVLLFAAVVQRAATGGFDPAGLELSFRPDGAGREALGAPAIWEDIHQGAFIYGFLVLMLGSLLNLCGLTPTARSSLLWAMFVAVLFDLVAPAAIALGAPGVLRVASFVAATAALTACIAVSWVRLGRDRR